MQNVRDLPILKLVIDGLMGLMIPVELVSAFIEVEKSAETYTGRPLADARGLEVGASVKLDDVAARDDGTDVIHG